MAVTEQSPINNYTGNGATTVFAFSFLVLAAADLSVKVSGVLKTLGVDYTVAGVGVGAGGTVTFLSAPAASAPVSIYRDSALARATDYQTNGDLLAGTINTDFDRLWLVLQEFISGGTGFGTTLRAPNGEAVAALPIASARAGLFLSFDSSGNPVMAAVGDGTAAALAAYIARGLAIDGSDNVVANVRVQSPRFEGTNTDDTGTPDAVFRAARTLSAGVLDGHGFRDQTTFSRTANSYASFDAAITSSGAGANDHIAGFQARPTVSRSGGSLVHVYNFVSAPTFNSGNATNNYGLFCFNPVGAGTVDYNYGVYIPNQNKGSISNHAIYVAQGGHKVFLGADTQVNQLLRVGGAAQLILGGATTSDYPMLGYNYDPALGTYQAADIAVSTKFDGNGFRVLTAAAGLAGAACTPVEKFRVDLNGNAYGPAGAAAMTNGFHYMPSGAGLPGTPAATPAGRVPFYYDTSTNKIGVYIGGSVWKWTAALT